MYVLQPLFARELKQRLYYFTQRCFQIMVLSVTHFQADPVSGCIFIALEFWFLHKGKLRGADMNPLCSGCSVDLAWGWPM